MNIFNRDPAKSVTRSIRNTIRRTIEGLVLLGGLVGCLVLLAGCPDSGGGKEKPKPTSTTPTPGGGGNTGAPSEPKITVGDPPFSVTLNENGPETLVDLPYKGQGGAVPTSCEVSSPAMVTVTKPCACLEGVCRVGVQPTPKVFGDGSFEFRLSGQSGQKEVSSNTGKASVKVLEVTLSISSGDKQDGIVGTNLPAPIVVLVQNSNKVPVSGVKIFWNVKIPEKANGKPVEDWTQEQIGKISSCTEITDDHGLAQCPTWTLGTVVVLIQKDEKVFIESQRVNASAFYSSGEIYKDTLGVSFSASAKSDVIASLSFWSIGFDLPLESWINAINRRPHKSAKAGVPLVSYDSDELWVFALDKYGNPTTVKEGGIDVTLFLGKKSAEGAVLSGGPSVKKMVNEDLEYLGYKWKQGIAKFKGLTVNRVGEYALEASGPADLDLKSDTTGDSFEVSPGAAAKLAFITQPGGGIAGVAWDSNSQPVVAFQDAYDNTVTSDEDPSSKAKIELAIGTNPSTPLGVLSGVDLSPNAVKGVATFLGLKIDRAGNGYTLKASASGAFLPVTSSLFNITP